MLHIEICCICHEKMKSTEIALTMVWTHILLILTLSNCAGFSDIHPGNDLTLIWLTVQSYTSEHSPSPAKLHTPWRDQQCQVTHFQGTKMYSENLYQGIEFNGCISATPFSGLTGCSFLWLLRASFKVPHQQGHVGALRRKLGRSPPCRKMVSFSSPFFLSFIFTKQFHTPICYSIGFYTLLFYIGPNGTT